jgi:predicted secreted hydrolase
VVAGVVVAASNAGRDMQGWRHADPEYTWSFPRDHWAHPEFQNEWWYFTGHLYSRDDPSRELGYQFTLFRIGLAPGAPVHASSWAANSVVMGHAAVGDLARGEHRFSEALHRNVPMLGGFNAFPDSILGWCRAPAGTDASWQLRWNGDAFDFEMADRARGIAFRLETHADKPLVFQGPNGFSRKGSGETNASMYASFTRLRTSGWVAVDGDTIAVRGTSWMDHEFSSNQLAENQIGWDWFSVQLDDGRDLMLYVMRDRNGRIDHATGTVVGADGSTRYLTRDDWSVESGDPWTSPPTKATYATAWHLRVPSEQIDVRLSARMRDQENRGRSLYYWEGAVDVEFAGRRVGRGYVELTGYGDGNRPPL